MPMLRCPICKGKHFFKVKEYPTWYLEWHKISLVASKAGLIVNLCDVSLDRVLKELESLTKGKSSSNSRKNLELMIKETKKSLSELIKTLT